MVPASEQTDAQQRRALLKVEQILQGATQVFLSQGYDRASMNQVAKTAGVSKQTLYVYFADKKALFKALVERMAKQRFQAVFEETSLEGSPEVVLPQLLQKGFTRIAQDIEYHDFIRMMIGESKRFPELVHVFFRNVTVPGIEIISDYLRNHPELEIPDAEATAHILVGASFFYMLTQEIMAGKDVLPMTQTRLSASLMHLLGISGELKASP